MAANDEFSMLSGPVPTGFAVYQMPGIQLGDHTFFGWKMVKQKSEAYTDEDGKEQKRSVDDETAAVIYDGTTQLIQANAELLTSNASQQLVNAQLLTSVANQQLVNAQIMTQLAAQMPEVK